MKRHTMTDKETNRLVQLAQSGDTAAADALVKEHFGLVVGVIRRLRRPVHHMEPEDLEQEGRLGLWDAVRYFDPERGAKFSTFATWRIMGRIKRAIDLDAIIHIPVKRAAQRREFVAVTASLDAPVALPGGVHGSDGGDREITLGETLRADDDPAAEIIAGIDYAAACALVARLPAAQREVVALLFGLDGGGTRQMREVARMLNLPSSTAHARCKVALRRLRHIAQQEETEK